MKRIVTGLLIMLSCSVFALNIPFEKLYEVERLSEYPVLTPGGIGFETKAVFNPATLNVNDKIYMFYRAEDWTGVNRWNGTSTIGLAWSDNGIDFERNTEPVIFPTEDYEIPGGCEDPRIVEIEGQYIMTYTGYDGAKARLCIAVSSDMKNWIKYGPIIQDFNWSKSGAIVPEKIDGKYYMYFGDSSIYLAYSMDLKNWTVYPRPVLKTRAGKFDSSLVEPGPPPIITDEGILLIYNSADYSKIYRPGAALFDLENPRNLLKRTENFLIEPVLSWEIAGQVPNVVFIEGAAIKDNQLFLYYGAADIYIGVLGLKF